MATSTSIEILDLRHFAAPVLRPVLEAEGEIWKQRLHWDYRASAKCSCNTWTTTCCPAMRRLRETR